MKGENPSLTAAGELLSALAGRMAACLACYATVY